MRPSGGRNRRGRDFQNQTHRGRLLTFTGSRIVYKRRCRPFTGSVLSSFIPTRRYFIRRVFAACNCSGITAAFSKALRSDRISAERGRKKGIPIHNTLTSLKVVFELGRR